jgi:hypothetical protein
MSHPFKLLNHKQSSVPGVTPVKISAAFPALPFSAGTNAQPKLVAKLCLQEVCL